MESHGDGDERRVAAVGFADGAARHA